MRYIISVLALAFCASAFATSAFYKEVGYVAGLRFSDSSIAESASQRRQYAILVERPRAAECGDWLGITPAGETNVGAKLIAAWLKGSQVHVGILDSTPNEQGGCNIVYAHTP